LTLPPYSTLPRCPKAGILICAPSNRCDCQEMSTAWHLHCNPDRVLVAVAAELRDPLCCCSLVLSPDSHIIYRSPPSLSSTSLCFSFLARPQPCHDLSNQCWLQKQPRNPSNLAILVRLIVWLVRPARLPGSRVLGLEICTATAAESTESTSSPSKAEGGPQ
jgi:hypothetical protein